MKIRMTWALMVLTCCFVGQVMAEETPPMPEALKTLENTLITFRESVDRLGQENKDMAVANEGLKVKVKFLLGQLELAKAEEAGILQKQKALEEVYQRKLPELQALQVRYAEAVHTLEIVRDERLKMEASLKDRESETEALADQYRALQKEIDGIRKGSPDAGVSEEKQKLEQQKVRLEKEVAEVSARVKNGRMEWEALSAVVNSGPSQIKALQEERDALQQGIVQKEKESMDFEAKIAQEKEFLSKIDERVINSETLAALEEETRGLEAKFRNVQKETAGLDRSIQEQKTRMAEARAAVQKKKEEAFRSAVEQNKRLLREVDRLRREMVALDKKKVRLEKGIY